MPSDELVRHVRKLGLRILGAPSLRWRRARLSVPVPTLDSRSFASSGYSSETLVVLTRIEVASSHTVAAPPALSIYHVFATRLGASLAVRPLAL